MHSASMTTTIPSMRVLCAQTLCQTTFGFSGSPVSEIDAFLDSPLKSSQKVYLMLMWESVIEEPESYTIWVVSLVIYAPDRTFYSNRFLTIPMNPSLYSLRDYEFCSSSRRRPADTQSTNWLSSNLQVSSEYTMVPIWAIQQAESPGLSLRLFLGRKKMSQSHSLILSSQKHIVLGLRSNSIRSYTRMGRRLWKKLRTSIMNLMSGYQGRVFLIRMSCLRLTQFAFDFSRQLARWNVWSKRSTSTLRMWLPRADTIRL